MRFWTPSYIPICLAFALLFGAKGFCADAEPAQEKKIYYPGEDDEGGRPAQDEIPAILFEGHRRPESDCTDTFIGPVVPGQEALKEHTDLMRYLTTHFKVTFPDRYKEYIKRAAAAFSLPEQFLVCLFVRESGPEMRIRAVSPVGASGISQLMPAVKTDIIRYIKGNSSDDLIRSLKESWHKFWESGERELNSSKLSHSSFSDPEVSIVGGTFWSKYYMEKLVRSMARPLTEIEKLLITSAAYNYGLRKKLIESCDEGTSYEECEERVGHLSHETYTHMKTIRHCMERGNWKSMDRLQIPRVKRQK